MNPVDVAILELNGPGTAPLKFHTLGGIDSSRIFWQVIRLTKRSTGFVSINMNEKPRQQAHVASSALKLTSSNELLVSGG
jgi:hypothetical protein